MDFILNFISLAFLAQIIRISIPYILAAMGGLFSERSGVTNIALEGIMLNGAFASVLGTYFTNSPTLGVISGIIAGILTAYIHAIISIRFKADQIISGVAINLLAVGVTKFFLKIVFDSSSNSSRVEGIKIFAIFPESNNFLSILNQIIGNPFIWLTFIIIILSHFILFKTVFGLRIRAVGEHPKAADTLGIKVNYLRYICVLISGALAGLSGSWLALDQHQFTDGMSNGRGFIAIAAVIFGRWNPLPVTAACLLFGFAEALQITLQSLGTNIPTQFIQMIPYVLTMIALAGFIGKSTPPAAAGKPYEEG
ncbi:MAG TPA: ABC transporter permease [bacterium]|nr:ABC transporter permease [bacterium]HOL46798.1 ABC transporter permease [bacterium]HPQ17753.1 ABC transporter permease [bacterium]